MTQFLIRLLEAIERGARAAREVLQRYKSQRLRVAPSPRAIAHAARLVYEVQNTIPEEHSRMGRSHHGHGTRLDGFEISITDRAQAVLLMIYSPVAGLPRYWIQETLDEIRAVFEGARIVEQWNTEAGGRGFSLVLDIPHPESWSVVPVQRMGDTTARSSLTFKRWIDQREKDLLEHLPS